MQKPCPEFRNELGFLGSFLQTLFRARLLPFDKFNHLLISITIDAKHSVDFVSTFAISWNGPYVNYKVSLKFLTRRWFLYHWKMIFTCKGLLSLWVIMHSLFLRSSIITKYLQLSHLHTFCSIPCLSTNSILHEGRWIIPSVLKNTYIFTFIITPFC